MPRIARGQPLSFITVGHEKGKTEDDESSCEETVHRSSNSTGRVYGSPGKILLTMLMVTMSAVTLTGSG